MGGTVVQAALLLQICKPGNGTVVFNNHVEVKGGTTCYTSENKDLPPC